MMYNQPLGPLLSRPCVNSFGSQTTVFIFSSIKDDIGYRDCLSFVLVLVCLKMLHYSLKRGTFVLQLHKSQANGTTKSSSQLMLLNTARNFQQEAIHFLRFAPK